MAEKMVNEMTKTLLQKELKSANIYYSPDIRVGKHLTHNTVWYDVAGYLSLDNESEIRNISLFGDEMMMILPNGINITQRRYFRGNSK
jgi:hypothetical protein